MTHGATARQSAPTRAWVREQLTLPARSAAVVLVLDPDGVASTPELASDGANVLEVRGWRDLRRVFEQHGRDRPESSPRLVLHVISGFGLPSDLPWDIERHANVLRLRWPATGLLREFLREVPLERSDAVVDAVRHAGAEAGLARLFGALLDGDPAHELEAVARMASHPDTGEATWRLASTTLRSPLSKAVAEANGDLAPVQGAWNDWLQHGASSAYAAVLDGARSGLAGLFASGQLRPGATTRDDLPLWTGVGVAAPAANDRLQALLATREGISSPAAVEDWFRVAAWWGAVRAAAALASPLSESVALEVASTWRDLNYQFAPWIQANLGQLMLASGNRPRTLDKTVSFLARRLREGADRVLLIVLDGLGFAQWSILSWTMSFRVLEATACVAMLPTLTSISRQAIFAGVVPAGFEASLLTTQREPTRWVAAWGEEGVPATSVGYLRTDGRDASDVPALGNERALGVVVTATDRILHGADVLGDAQLAGDVQLWAQHGFLVTFLEAAHDAGFEVWLTSDHGNLVARPARAPREGLAVEHTGTRVRLYRTRALRDAARAEGVMWDPPGLPDTGPFPLFARENFGFHGGGERVSHGGMSLDEVVVPFVRLAP